MNFGIDINKLINRLIMPTLRKPIHIAWLQALTAPIKYLHTQLLIFIAPTNFEIQINGQVLKLRYALNTKYDSTDKRIFIRDTPIIAQLYTYNEIENKPEYMPFFMNGGGSDFDVVVPFDLQGEEVNIKSLLNKYKLPGKRYQIIYI